MIEMTGQSYIAGNWISPEGRVFESFNPYNGKTMFNFTSCGERQVELAARAAQEAFQVLRNLDGKTIGQFLNRIADEIEALGDQLPDALKNDNPLRIYRHVNGEMTRDAIR